MKRILQAGILVVASLALAIPASAHEYSRKTDGHLLRVVAYAFHAVGIATEYAVTRPIHWAVSQGELDIVFGHQSYIADDGTYFAWEHADHSPSIAVERAARSKTNQKMVK